MTHTSVLMLSLLVIAPASSIQVMFDSVSNCNGSGVIDCNVRVHKINKTTAALMGELVQNMEVDDSYVGSVELHHSSLGNNQFNRYPMKMGPTGMCDFLDKYWDDYYEYAVKYAPNIVKPRECPFGAKTYQIVDWIMDSEMLPQYVPTGLWKVISLLSSTKNEHFFVIEIIFKVYEDGYF
ncbi:uncharacterized protein LOC119768730 [Culex quinquefasciatus]|uniref:uncharacterized protein LOC119768730 n=1 Tax=Culex quinquefasciatus TaxID=7176 RepID=UPI0018E2D2B2|nr:uncharacterized protein LOC119768730 [Culex quinquefasciatus]